MENELKIKSEIRKGEEMWYIEGISPREWYDSEDDAQVALRSILDGLF